MLMKWMEACEGENEANKAKKRLHFIQNARNATYFLIYTAFTEQWPKQQNEYFHIVAEREIAI